MPKDFLIVVVRDFSTRPYGRYYKDGDRSGAKFRDEFLLPALQNNDHVTVDLTGYNLYGRSFIDEAFGGLIREGGYSLSDLQDKLTIRHDDVPPVVALAWSRIAHASKSKKR
ncbi:STAS-like domain-containing protein [Marinobacter persicus]|uniref:Uncharacterized protein DUF4325 n=1 Tax=Marinobacter persicus TaxID=930118 RepID=A0A2S6G664_9GAMM|nr:STAS-like domain-containing protein [Marinobacter persicus]PPK51247.1 uncharacterized protein DUF4325 [Marinobacter persicus]PPK54516.1 uncharacterized protein DUF4325 [Marinobacter persicus]PPK57842.1 uncharacterized protein DUF4325 [Marinobacter persicus]